MPKPQNQQGAGVARNAMHVIADAVIKIRTAMAPMENAEKWRHNTAFLETLEQELAPTVAGLYAPILEAENCPQGLRDFINQISNPTHQADALQSLVGIIGAIIALFPAMGQIAIRQNIMDFNAQIPNVPLSPPDAAEATMRGIIDIGQGEEQASLSGVGSDVFGWLIGITGEPPGPANSVPVAASVTVVKPPV